MATDQPQAQVCPETKSSLERLIVQHLSAWIPAPLNVIGAFPTAARQDARELADAILATLPLLPSLQDWRGIESLPDRYKLTGSIWRSLDGKVFATLDNRWCITLPAPPSIEKSGGEK